MSITGTEINGYRITNFIDSGGFGSVYKAEKNGIYFAIKIFREDYVLKEYREKGENNRIRREIDIMKSVSHPNLIKYVDDFKHTISGVPSYFLVMEFAEGITLRNSITNNNLSEKDASEIFINILDGIDALHSIRGNNDNTGIIHRDLKPENIIVNGKNVKILDYGISKIIDYTSITNTGEVMGSPVYMSPEQIKDSKHIDKRSDIYTLGVILYEMLTKEKPYEFGSLPELYSKILKETPIPPRRWNLFIDNQLENIILKLLEKHPYQRYVSIAELKNAFLIRKPKSTIKTYDTSIRYYIRLWNEKSAIQEFSERYDKEINVIFPINFQNQQKNLLKTIKSKTFNKIIDPATVRLAYAAQQNVKGLQELPYAPSKFNVITPSYLSLNSKKQEYVKQVIDAQAKISPQILLSPFHYVNNTNVSPTQKRNPVAEWFDLDIKLIKESIDYKNSVSEYRSKPLYAGICINGNSLTDEHYRTDFLNIFSSLESDGYIIYVDNISNKTDQSILYHYAKTLATLQNITQKPVIAGRVNPGIGLGLIASGISGFSSGTSRFDSFYEGLYKEDSDAYNMYERHFIPSLLSIIPVLRKNPVKLKQIFDTIGFCDCYYCKNKEYVEVIKSASNKLHYLETIHSEIEKIKVLKVEDRLPYFINIVDGAISKYKSLGNVFKPSDYSHLLNWKEVFEELNK